MNGHLQPSRVHELERRWVVTRLFAGSLAQAVVDYLVALWHADAAARAGRGGAPCTGLRGCGAAARAREALETPARRRLEPATAG